MDRGSAEEAESIATLYYTTAQLHYIEPVRCVRFRFNISCVLKLRTEKDSSVELKDLDLAVLSTCDAIHRSV